MAKARTRTARAIGAVIVGLVATLLVQAGTTAPASAATYAIVVIHHNIGGGQDFGGDIAAINKVENAFGDYPWASVITMNEVCASQRDEFKRIHGTTWSYFWVKTKRDPASAGHAGCTGNAPPGTTSDEIGEMIASPYLFNATYKYCLMPDANGNRIPDLSCDTARNPSGELDAQGMLCAYVQIPGLPTGSTGYKACTAHIGTLGGDSGRAVKTGWMDSLLQADHGSRIVTLSGDLNSTPELDSLSNLYRQTWTNGNYTGPGDFVDADATNTAYFSPTDPHCHTAMTGPSRPAMCRTGQPTNDAGNRKIDYVFYPFDRMKFGTYGASVVATITKTSTAWHHSLLITGGYVEY